MDADRLARVKAMVGFRSSLGQEQHDGTTTWGLGPMGCALEKLGIWKQRAETLNWKWRYGTSRKLEAPAIKARGTLITDNDPDRDGAYSILRIRGQRNGEKITGLYAAGSSIPGNSPYEGDNLIWPLRQSKGRGRPAPAPQLSGHGFQFSLEDETYSNVFFADFTTPSSYLEFHSRFPYPDGAQPPNTEVAVAFKAWTVA